MGRPKILARRWFTPIARRPRRGLEPDVRPLEGRRLLSGAPAATATMSQTVSFPDLEDHPTLSDQGLLYFSATMGTLTEVDVVTSGSFQARFSAENLGATGQTITGTTAANLAVNLPTGPIAVGVPAVTESFNAAGYDGTLDDGGASGRAMAPVSSNSTPQTTVYTSPADLAAFTGHFRIPISVDGHATGTASSANGDISSAFQTDTSATITVIYHYTPDFSGPAQPAAASTSGGAAGTSPAPSIATGTASTQGSGQGTSALSTGSSTANQQHGTARTRIALHHHAHHRTAASRPAVALHRHRPMAAR